MSKTHAMFIAIVIVFCGCVQVTAQVPAVTPSPNDRELLLIERIENLERRLAELEAKLKTTPDRNPVLNPTFATLPTQPGLSTDVVRPVPSGRFHVLDTYYTFAVKDK